MLKSTEIFMLICRIAGIDVNHNLPFRIDPEANGDHALRHPESFFSIHGFSRCTFS